jgi:hypothetical protein
MTNDPRTKTAGADKNPLSPLVIQHSTFFVISAAIDRKGIVTDATRA